MTREELKEHCERQIQQFERVEKIMPVTPNDWKRYEEHKLILELLEQEPQSEWEQDHAILKAYSNGANEVLDKIRAEMLEEKECAYADFERYKVEYLGQDWEDALDSLPQDDFRYGMERAIEILDKYKAESEG